MEKSKVAQNAVWIIGIQLIKAILGVVISMMTARFLGPSNFGIINYASSIVTFVTPIMQVGLTGVLVQEFVSNPEKESEILGTSITLSLFSSFICILGVFAFVSNVNCDENETIVVCMLYSILLIFQALEMTTYWFQAKLLSKYSSFVSLLAYVGTSAYKIFLLVTQKSIYWFAVSNALDYMLIAVGLFIVYRKLGGERFSFSWQTAKRLFSKSRYYIVSNMMITIFAQTDKIMLKLMLNAEATGFYSAAITCAGMSGFVFSAIIDSFRPMIFDDKRKDKKQYEKDMCRLYSIIIYMSLLQSLVISLFSGWIIRILYGVDYLPAADVLCLVVWYTTFSYLGSVRNIWILAEEKQTYLWKINLSGAVTNVVLNYFLIPDMGMMGAALASLLTQVFTNVFIGFIVKPLRYNNMLMVKALNLKNLLVDLKSIINKERNKNYEGNDD